MPSKLNAGQVLSIESRAIPHGQTHRFNHEACSAGTDTRRRLYVNKQTNGAHLWYCHNCSEGGIFGRGPRVRSGAAGTPIGTTYTPPVGIKLTELGELWLKAWGIRPSPAHLSTPDDDGIIFTFSEGHQIRWFNKPGLKWQIFGDCECNIVGGDIIVAEDMISVFKFVEADINHGGICLFGNNVSKAVASDNGAMYLVWLDNDNDKVNENAELVARKLSAYSKNVVLCTGGTDPKRYTAKELIDVRDQARKLCGTPATADKPYHVLEVPIPNQRVRAGLGVKRNPSGPGGILRGTPSP